MSCQIFIFDGVFCDMTDLPKGFKTRKKKRPVIMTFQPTGYRKIEDPSELKIHLENRGKYTGLPLGTDSVVGNAYYETTCGTGSYDDCSETDPGEQLDL